MNKFIVNICLTVAFAALCSCSSSTEDATDADGTRLPITFTPMEIAASRASQATVGTLSAYGVSCAAYDSAETYATAAAGSYFYKEEVAAATGSSHHYWPGDRYKVSFYAYAPYSDENITISPATAAGRPTYTVITPADINRQADFITAEVLDHSGTPTATTVRLSFYHRCADVRIAVYNRGYDPITVNSITISGVRYQGSFDGTAWTLAGDANTTTNHPFTLTPADATVAAGDTIDMTGTDGHFILLPQTIASGTDFITVNTTIAGISKDHIYTLPADFTLQQGHSHNITISLSADYISVDTSSDITDWGVETKYLTTDGTVTDGNMNQPGADGIDNNAQDWGKQSTTTTTDGVKTDGNMDQPSIDNNSGTTAKDWESQDGQPS